jgi:hypothetical protein
MDELAALLITGTLAALAVSHVMLTVAVHRLRATVEFLLEREQDAPTGGRR